ncbi:hypothetical protein PIB30_046642 [Stylosanthes scabra]|uniref:Uncharacterized protein n=1 Tax=Stylosanthes scabra TaxID=79078 RepID=A0ABU6XGS4_9FABA|nr:hypothetical protein [Stylosanthes scabra]
MDVNDEEQPLKYAKVQISSLHALKFVHDSLHHTWDSSSQHTRTSNTTIALSLIDFPSSLFVVSTPSPFSPLEAPSVTVSAQPQVP